MKNQSCDYILNDFISFRIMQLSNSLNRQSVRILSKHSNLRLPEWRCLTVIIVNGPLHIGKIADILSSDFGQVSRAVTALVKMGYVVSERNKKDKRQIKVEVSILGLEEFEKIMPILRGRQKLLSNSLGNSEYQVLKSAIEKLRKAIEKFEINNKAV